MFGVFLLGVIAIIYGAVLLFKFRNEVNEQKKNDVEKPFAKAMESKRNSNYFAYGIVLLIFGFVLLIPYWAEQVEENEYKKYSSSSSSSYSSSSSSYGSSSSSYSSSSSSFTNKYGSPSTTCAHPGCTNKIASSGDTNCCTTHSRRCANCGCYIDEDATYCMDCLRSAFD